MVVWGSVRSGGGLGTERHDPAEEVLLLTALPLTERNGGGTPNDDYDDDDALKTYVYFDKEKRSPSIMKMTFQIYLRQRKLLLTFILFCRSSSFARVGRSGRSGCSSFIGSHLRSARNFNYRDRSLVGIEEVKSFDINI